MRFGEGEKKKKKKKKKKNGELKWKMKGNSEMGRSGTWKASGIGTKNATFSAHCLKPSLQESVTHT